MTIEKGEQWGATVGRPDDLRVAADDAELARLLADGTDLPVAVLSGDMFATIGARPIADRAELQRLPIDLMMVSLDGRDPVAAVSHLVARAPVWRGGWFRDGVLIVMNAEFLGRWDLAPRGHPNDGRVESLDLHESLGVRARLAVRARSRNGTHLPHPAIATRSIRSGRWTFDRPRHVEIDGRSVGTARSIDLDVVADAAAIHA